MNPLDEAWLVLKGVLGGAEDKARADEQIAQWAKIQEDDKRRLQQEKVEDPGFDIEDFKQAAGGETPMNEMAEELARLQAEIDKFKARQEAIEAKYADVAPVDGKPAVE